MEDDRFTPSDYMSNSEYMSEALFQYASVYGEERQDEEWIASPYDTWHRNPHYTGKPGRHPEEDYEEEPPYEGEWHKEEFDEE